MIQQADPCLLRSWRTGATLHVRDEQGRFLSGPDGWERLEGDLIRYTLALPLRWLGVVAVDQDVTAFQVTPLGGALLGLTSGWPEEPAPRPLIVQPNFEVLAPAETNPAHVYRLADFADAVKRDRLSVYALTKESILRSLENGDTAELIIAFLQEASGRELPQNVEYSLREWGGKYGDVEVKRVTVLTTATDALMQELRGSRKLKLSWQEELGPKAVGLADEEWGSLLTRLKKAGYLPKVGTGLGKATEGEAYRVKLLEAELVLLLAAARVAEARGAGPLFPQGLLDHLERLLGSANQEESRGMARQMELLVDEEARLAAATPRQPAARFSTALTLPRLEEAVLRQNTVDIEYYDDNTGEIVKDRVDPYRLERRRTLVFVVGFSHSRHTERAFLVEQIRSVEPTGLRFKKRGI